MAIIAILRMTMASTIKTKKFLTGLSLEGLIYILLSLALVSHALDIYRHFPFFYWISLGSGVVASFALLSGLCGSFGRILLGVHILLHLGLIVFSLPDLTNHEVVLFLCYILILFGFWKDSKKPLNVLQGLLPLIFFWMYFWAGFHKLNMDFLHGSSSCAAFMVSKMFSLQLSQVQTNIVAVLIIAVEFFLAITVMMPRWRKIFLITAFSFHSLLLLGDFAPFTANIYVLLLLLLPEEILSSWLKTKAKRNLLFYTAFVMIGVSLFEFSLGKIPIQVSLAFREWPFFIGALPAVASLARLSVSSWRLTPTHFSWILSGLLFFWGFQTYLGLRSNGVFDMYSNVSTDRSHANHLLVPIFLTETFPYQEDLVRVQFIKPPRHWKLSRLQNSWVPRITLLNLVESLQDVEGPLEAQIETTQGAFFTSDLVREQNSLWREKTYGSSFLMKKYLDMRPVGSGKCQW